MVKTKKQALAIVGGLAKPSKMPGFSIGLPARECKVGSKLREKPGSVCSKCYAMKGLYGFPVVQQAQYRRLEALANPYWVPAMVRLITGQKHFRWHDSGDLQNFQHLRNIIRVCEATPETKHWLPTREKALIVRYTKMFGDFPGNLVVRLSMPMIGMSPRSTVKHTSTVHTIEPFGHVCPAPTQGGECCGCRACWDPTVLNVSYHQH